MNDHPLSQSDASEYPLVVLNEQRCEIARINPDATWSVNWSAVIDQAYRPITPQNMIITAVCKVLFAAKDNFHTTRWDAPAQLWEYESTVIGSNLNPPSDEFIALVIAVMPYDNPIALLTWGGEWYVNWEQAFEGRSRLLPPLNGFCSMLLGARDNFPAKPMAACPVITSRAL